MDENLDFIPWVRRITIEKESDDIVSRLETRIKQLEGELNNIDELLARRDALDSEPTRYAKILKAINTLIEIYERIERIEYLVQHDILKK